MQPMLASILLLDSLSVRGRLARTGFPLLISRPSCPRCSAAWGGPAAQVWLALAAWASSSLLLHCLSKALRLRMGLPRPCVTMQLESLQPGSTPLGVDTGLPDSPVSQSLEWQMALSWLSNILTRLLLPPGAVVCS